MARPKATPERVAWLFWTKVDATGDCWEWTRALAVGYGKCWDGDKPMLAHRWAYEHLIGPIPEGLVLDHLCRNRRCVNPDHLRVVTRKVNNLAGYSAHAQNARVRACPQGHEYTPQNTSMEPSAHGQKRRCRECAREKIRQLRQRRRAIEQEAAK
jgi:hypothetical protein